MKMCFLRLVRISLVVLGAAGVAALAAAAAGTAATVKTAQSAKFGTLLVTSTGLTLYQLGSEKPGTIACTGACAQAWPPLLLAPGAKLAAGTGVSRAKLGTIKRPDHGTQVTFGGKALYRFESDRLPGAVTGQNVAGFHVVVLAAPAHATTAPPAAATTTPTTPTTPTTTSNGYGYG